MEDDSIIENEKYQINIVWGSRPEKDSNLFEYKFNTQAELDAFIKGIKEAEGWLGYTVIEPDKYIEWKNSDEGIEYFS